jgi:hypothetical protein
VVKPKRKIERCPTCLPDSRGAIFHFETDLVDDHWVEEWVCQNCGHRAKAGKRPTPSGKPTPSQKAILTVIEREFGGTIETKFHGRSLWVGAHNPERHPMAYGDRLYGSVGPMGKLKLTLARIGGDREITNARYLDIDIRGPKRKEGDVPRKEE